MSGNFAEKSPDFVFKHRKENADNDLFDRLFVDAPCHDAPDGKFSRKNSSDFFDSSSKDYLSFKSKSSSLATQSPRLFKTFEEESFDKSAKKVKKKNKQRLKARQVTCRTKKPGSFQPQPFLSESSLFRISNHMNRVTSNKFDLISYFPKDEGPERRSELVRSVSSVIGQTAPDVLLDDLSPVKAANPGAIYSSSLVDETSVVQISVNAVTNDPFYVTSTPTLGLDSRRSVSKLWPLQKEPIDYGMISKDLFDDFSEKTELMDKISKLSLSAYPNESFKRLGNANKCPKEKSFDALAQNAANEESYKLPIIHDKSLEGKFSCTKPKKKRHRNRPSVVVGLKTPSWSKLSSSRPSLNVNLYRRRFTHHPVFEIDTRKSRNPILDLEKANPETVEDVQTFVLNEESRSSRRITRVHLSSSYIISILDNEEPNISLNEISINKSIEPRSVLEMVMKRCNQEQLLNLKAVYDEDVLKKSKKIGEGAFGEVFLLATCDSPVLKIVPVDGTALVNGLSQTKLSDMLAEIIVTTELSNLAEDRSRMSEVANFVKVRKCYLTQGEYPEPLLHLWDIYNEEQGSENDRPDSNLFGDQLQMFVVLEFSNGGNDLEHAELKNGAQGLSIFMQVVHSLAVAESVLEFEHRDLHWGNILVRETDAPFLVYNINGKSYEIKTHGVSATIIDFSLSRLTSPNDDCKVFNNLAEDEDLFSATGEEYQFEIYRLMRDHTKNEWQQFYPKTNVFWMHYLLDKLCSMVRYKSKKSKVHSSAMSTLRKLKGKMLEFQSCTEFVINSTNQQN